MTTDQHLDTERLLDNAGTCSQVIELLRADDGGEPALRECVRINVCDPLATEIKRLRGALVKAVEVIRQWHGMGVPKKQEHELWTIYWRSAPEMKQVREALTALSQSHE